jgi:pimeloyl-ACP methyl ester carboxylesterase
MSRLDALRRPKIARLYGDVPDEHLARFRRFHADHPTHHVAIDGVDWATITAGHGEPAVLLLPGADGVPDLRWEHIAHFAQGGRVVGPEYAPLKSMDALVDGIAGILRQEGIAQAHVIGDSYGGFVAQAFVRRHPQLTASLVLSHTLPPDPASGQLVKSTLSYLSVFPMFLLRRMVGNRLRSLLPVKTAETALYHAILNETIGHRLTKKGLINSYWRLVDFNLSGFTSQDLASWPGRVMLILSDDDPGMPEAARQGLQAFYPQAEVHLFHGTGHATALVRREEFLAVIDRFIDSGPRAVGGT